MRVKIQIEFVVEGLEDDELTEDNAKSAASSAAWDYLSLCEISSVCTDVDEVTVHVDGYGKCAVSIGDDHE